MNFYLLADLTFQNIIETVFDVFSYFYKFIAGSPLLAIAVFVPIVAFSIFAIIQAFIK